MQLEDTFMMTDLMLENARKILKKVKRQTPFLEEYPELSNVRGPVQCPFCMYTSKKNKTSAIIKNDCFKCFHCGIGGRVR